MYLDNEKLLCSHPPKWWCRAGFSPAHSVHLFVISVCTSRFSSCVITWLKKLEFNGERF